jgi:hypothetical protein
MVREFRAGDLPRIKDIGNRAWRGIHAMYREILGAELFSVLVPEPGTSKGEEVAAHCAAHPDYGRYGIGTGDFHCHERLDFGIICRTGTQPNWRTAPAFRSSHRSINTTIISAARTA